MFGQHSNRRRWERVFSERSPGFFVAPALMAYAFVSGCGSAPPAVNGSGPLAGAWSYAYTCEGSSTFSARDLGDLVAVTVDGHRVELAPQADASGTFAGEGYTLTLRNGDAHLATPAGIRTGCTGRPASNPWQDAALRGVHYRAVGQEPGWYVEVTPDRSLLYVGDYGLEVILAGPPQSTADPVRARTEFTAATPSDQVVLSVLETPCIDTMSGEGFTTRAMVTVAGTTYQGCGRWLE